MKSNVQLILIVFILMSITSACQKQSKYAGAVKVEYTPRHINLIRPIVEPERIYQMSLDEKRFVCLPEEMKEMENLRELYLTDLKVKDWSKSAEIINSFKKLNTLFINYDHFNELPFNPAELTNLERLYLSYSEGFQFKQEIKKLSKLKKLHTLGLAGIHIDSIPEEFLSLETLKRVQIGEFDNFDYDQGFTQLNKLPELKRLDIIYSNLNPLPKSFKKLKQIRKLGMYHCQVDLNILFSVISNWKQLEFLELGEMNIERLPEDLNKLTNLRKINLNDNHNLDHKALFRQLAELPRLEELDISETILHQQYDRFVMPEELAELKNLKRLDMATSRNVVFDSLFNMLAKLPKLEKLNLYDCKTYLNKEWEFTTIPNYISEFQNLKELNIKRTFINILRNVEKFPPSLEKLNFSQVGFGREGIFPSVILNATSLKSLNLNDCELKNLPAEIGNLKNLVNLDLGNNQLKDLPESITKLKKLRYLNLMGTHIAESKEKRKEIEQMLPNTLIFFGEYEAYEPI
jgi:Leucine-rich repeat (LRR) protein